MKEIKTSAMVLFLFTILFGVVYPVFTWGVGRLLFREQTDGSLIQKKGVVIGSKLIGQNFTSEKYFHPRPSAAHYDASNSTGSNLGSASQKLIDDVKGRIAKYRSENNWTKDIPVDAVTASGSGLDPHISPAAAEYQVARVARARGLGEAQVRSLVAHFTESRQMGLLGEYRVNVLRLNLALDELGRK